MSKFEPNLEDEAKLGAILLQEQVNGDVKPVFYTSRLLSSSEKRYAQIQREVLASTWACKRLSDFLVGLKSCINIWRNCQLDSKRSNVHKKMTHFAKKWPSTAEKVGQKKDELRV